jgi:hypothetical protein
MIKQTDPLRRTLLNRYVNFLGGIDTGMIPELFNSNFQGTPQQGNFQTGQPTAPQTAQTTGGPTDFRTDVLSAMSVAPPNFSGAVATPSPEALNLGQNPEFASTGIEGQPIEAGGFDVTASPLFDPIFGAAQDQFNIANESVLSNLPQGGALQEALAENARRRAQTITGASADIAQQELNNLMQLVSGGTAQGLQSLGMGTSALASLAGQQANAQAAQNAGTMSMFGMLGQGFGDLMGGK